MVVEFGLPFCELPLTIQAGIDLDPHLERCSPGIFDLDHGGVQGRAFFKPGRLAPWTLYVHQ
jgi:hypothetical protein